jgi:hypothetical protein
MDCMIALNPDFPFRMRTASPKRTGGQGGSRLISREMHTVVFYRREGSVNHSKKQHQGVRP